MSLVNRNVGISPFCASSPVDSAAGTRRLLYYSTDTGFLEGVVATAG